MVRHRHPISSSVPADSPVPIFSLALTLPSCCIPNARLVAAVFVSATMLILTRAVAKLAARSEVVLVLTRAIAKLAARADVIAGVIALLESVLMVRGAGVIAVLVLVASKVSIVGVLASRVDVEAALILARTVVGRLAAVLSVFGLIGDLAEGLSQCRASFRPLCADWAG